MSGTRYTVNSDGDVEMLIPQPIFEVIRTPELSSWEHAALIHWHREWERYDSKESGCLCAKEACVLCDRHGHHGCRGCTLRYPQE
ncbi:hypothetical protein PC129_g7298 [Phytophthora cactorum]|uniref:Uncharacterized protein n=1 Tax=Phytophthora cactorum TaxID=29920 RepID=A0A8T1E0R0_9STRA|nr:hypothetical protein Pcac1_g6576 [Phytophthora cactorum]KAG2861379.1 hypothetical protein PC113_g7214 [Phytophthora cactorum]KAG2916858.1 hypothetical protein PC114_g7338 [Phytophthora cactorum]KAG2930936.1 hypothetical protein PC115_g6241 [Phytophthora cactorum]KAG2946848.1 hypothetical protein PC117_g7297 [Phytophthora cactorum]